MRKRVPAILVTGGAGFIGSEFVRQAVKKKKKVVVVDSLTYAGDLKRLEEVKGRFKFHKADIVNADRIDKIIKKEKPRTIVHFAAETHVDRSILDAEPFIETNITGTQNLIRSALLHDVKKFVHISTDEIYGQSKSGHFKETDPIKPRNPYAATKASAELIVQASIETYGLPAVIIRPSNNYGPWQYPEKFIPVIVAKALNNERVPVYGRGKQVREWLYVGDCARAIHFLVNKGKKGAVYNIGSYFEQNNLTTAKAVLKQLGKDQKLILFVKDRPGHDFRYSVRCTKLRRLGWRPKISFKKGIEQTIQWYIENNDWLEEKREHLNSYWRDVYTETS